MITITLYEHGQSDGRRIQAKPGTTLMKAALANDIEGIAADCGGTLTCATCHVMVRAPWAEQLPPEARIPTSLSDALQALAEDPAMGHGFGTDFVRHYSRLKAAEQQRFEAAEDKLEFQRREYFSRI